MEGRQYKRYEARLHAILRAGLKTLHSVVNYEVSVTMVFLTISSLSV